MGWGPQVPSLQIEAFIHRQGELHTCRPHLLVHPPLPCFPRAVGHTLRFGTLRGLSDTCSDSDRYFRCLNLVWKTDIIITAKVFGAYGGILSISLHFHRLLGGRS